MPDGNQVSPESSQEVNPSFDLNSQHTSFPPQNEPFNLISYSGTFYPITGSSSTGVTLEEVLAHPVTDWLNGIVI